jgi:hypothetical protein
MKQSLLKHPWGAAGICWLLVFAISGCAKNSRSASPDSPTPSLSHAEAEFYQNERELQQLLGRTGTERKDGSGAGGANVVVPAPPSTRYTVPDGTSSTTPTSTNACGTACKALASMRRSAQTICEISGDDSPKCKQIRQKLDDNTDFVKSRGCQCEPSH